MLFFRDRPKARVLMVCMGNICRSPMAQRVMEKQLADAGLAKVVAVDSAGTHAVRGSDSPDPRARTLLTARGYTGGRLRPRQIVDADFSRNDLILAMDKTNMMELRGLCPAEFTHKLRLLMEFSPGATDLDVPDPYYGSPKGFEHVLALIEPAITAVISQHRQIWS
jgi:protein-tyrosine phosphatase